MVWHLFVQSDIVTQAVGNPSNYGRHGSANGVDIGYALNAYPQNNTIIAIPQSLRIPPLRSMIEHHSCRSVSSLLSETNVVVGKDGISSHLRHRSFGTYANLSLIGASL